MRTRHLCLLLLCPSLAFAAWTQVGEGTASFDAKGPAGFKIHGDAKNVGVTDDGTTLAVSLALKDIDTDNGLRNKHMLEDTQAEQFPKMTLSVPVAAIKAPADGKSLEGEATGSFTLHGQTKSMPFKYTARCQGPECTIDATANVNDFGIKIRSYLGVTVKPDLVIGAKFTLRR